MDSKIIYLLLSIVLVYYDRHIYNKEQFSHEEVLVIAIEKLWITKCTLVFVIYKYFNFQI